MTVKAGRNQFCGGCTSPGQDFLAAPTNPGPLRRCGARSDPVFGRDGKWVQRLFASPQAVIRNRVALMSPQCFALARFSAMGPSVIRPTRRLAQLASRGVRWPLDPPLFELPAQGARAVLPSQRQLLIMALAANQGATKLPQAPDGGKTWKELEASFAPSCSRGRSLFHISSSAGPDQSLLAMEASRCSPSREFDHRFLALPAVRTSWNQSGGLILCFA